MTPANGLLLIRTSTAGHADERRAPSHSIAYRYGHDSPHVTNATIYPKVGKIVNAEYRSQNTFAFPSAKAKSRVRTAGDNKAKTPEMLWKSPFQS